MENQIELSSEEAESENFEPTRETSKSIESKKRRQSKRSKVETMESQVRPNKKGSEDEVTSKSYKPNHEEHMKDYQQKVPKEREINEELPKRCPIKRSDLGSFCNPCLLENF